MSPFVPRKILHAVSMQQQEVRSKHTMSISKHKVNTVPPLQLTVAVERLSSTTALQKLPAKEALSFIQRETLLQIIWKELPMIAKSVSSRERIHSPSMAVYIHQAEQMHLCCIKAPVVMQKKEHHS